METNMERLSILEPPNPLTPFQRLVEPYNFSFTFTSAFSSTSTPTTVSTPKITITTPAPNQGHGNSLSDTMACGRTRKKAIIKIRGSSLSAEEKDKQILQVVEKATIASRPKPVPIKAAQRIEHTRVLTGWPKVHAEMNLQDLIVARGLLMVTLAGKAQVAGMAYIISRFEAADTVCKTLWGTATILRDLISEPTNANIFGPSQGLHVIPDLIYRYAIREMERVVEVLTCRMLYKTRNTSSMKTFGEMEGIAYTLHTKQGKGLVMFGDLLLKGIREANMQYVRGILETLGIYSKMMGSEREDPKELRRFLTKKKNYMHHQGIEGRKTEVTGMVGQDANKFPIKKGLILANLPRTGKRYRDPGQDSSEGSADEDAVGDDKDHNASKKIRHNGYRSCSDPEPELEETPAMEKFRRDVERVKIFGD